MARIRHTMVQVGNQTGFLTKLNLYCLTREDARRLVGNDDVANFQLLTPFLYRSEILGGVIEIHTEPKPFITDLGSIPRFFWRFLSPDDYDISYPSVVHDYLYDKKGDLHGQPNLALKRVTRKMADQVLREAMTAVEAPAWKRLVVYLAVRWFGPRW